MGSDLLLVIVVGTALAFDFTNGFHDTANAMATSIATGALKPKVAVAISAVLNVVGAFLSLKVATTIAEGIVKSDLISLDVVFAALLGATAWNVLTWLLSLPSSSTHALIGGIVGAAWVAKGSDAIQGDGLVGKVLVPAVVAPVLAAGIALLATFCAYRLTARADADGAKRGFRIGQIGSASLVSLAHGTNDAQKTMGVITLALIAHGSLSADASVPAWVVIASATAIGLGTYLGGWRIIKTLGHKLTDVEPPQGFAAETSGATVLLASSYFGYPLSTTHIVSGSVLGSGLGRKLASVRWGVAGQMAVAWVVTLPAAALAGGGVFALVDGLGPRTVGPIVASVVALGLGVLAYVVSQRSPVTASDV